MQMVWVVVAIAVGLLALEGGLRWRFGLGTPPRYVADSQVGYRLAPNQRLRRFGNRLVVNQYSMRGEAIQANPEAGTVRLLLLGDSIANGGWWTDQAQILSEQMRPWVAQGLDLPLEQVEILNASANSWGPRNELAYVAKFGTFGARGVVLLLNTDDLFALEPHSWGVGYDRNYPTHNPPLALWELASRLRRRRPHPRQVALEENSGDRVGANLEAIRQLYRLVATEGGFLVLAMTPLLREVVPPGPRSYEREARDRLLALTQTLALPYLDFLAKFQAHPDPHSLYRDHIHLSPTGNALVAEALGTLALTALQGEPMPHAPLGPPPPDPSADPW